MMKSNLPTWLRGSWGARMAMATAVTAAAMCSAIGARTAPSEPPPRLVLWITVDQLRGDMPDRLMGRFGEGGFKLLAERGVWYTNAHYRHSTTFTSVGHASLFTGANPPEHGVVGNDWLDRTTGRRVYSVEDERHQLLDAPTAPHQGVSPNTLMSSTIGDELVLAGGGRDGSRVFSVSIKDRGAILPGGRLGTAYWYHSSSGRFVTSTYYMEAYPVWVEAWNSSKPTNRYAGAQWTLMHDIGDYQHADADNRLCEVPYGAMGRVFPHPLPAEPGSALFKTLPYTPYGDELTLDFVRTLVTEECIGRGLATDMLAISLSGTDYIGHAFGPNSLEAEDNLLRVDAMLAELFGFIDDQIGLDRTIIVLSSDHGVDASPEHRCTLECGAAVGGATAAGDPRLEPTPVGGVMFRSGRVPVGAACCSAGRHYPQEFIAAANAELRTRLNIDGDLIVAFWNPSVYLDDSLMQQRGLDRAVVEQIAAEVLEAQPGIARALTRTALMSGRTADDMVSRRVRRAFHPKRSGDLLIVQDPFWYLYPEPRAYAAMHGSPYAYDTHVPVVIVAPGVGARRAHRTIGPEDIAPTIAALLNVPRPSGCTGQPLVEVLDIQ